MAVSRSWKFCGHGHFAASFTRGLGSLGFELPCCCAINQKQHQRFLVHSINISQNICDCSIRLLRLKGLCLSNTRACALSPLKIGFGQPWTRATRPSLWTAPRFEDRLDYKEQGDTVACQSMLLYKHVASLECPQLNRKMHYKSLETVEHSCC